jgi:CheY-like chemotaxis protein
MTSASKRIVIVDDEEDLTWSISRSLRKENGRYEIICVNSGDEALNFLNRISFDLLISDIRMPGQNGFMLLSYVKKHQPDMKVIIMSAWYGAEVKTIFERTSNIYFIEKPFDIGNLKNIINQALDNKPDKYKDRLIDLNLKDIIRHNCQKKLNGYLNVSNGKENGEIHFRAGEVIHVQVGEMEGEGAFLDVLNWNNFEYDTVLTNKPIKKTIGQDWKMLIERCNPQS